MYFGSEVNNPSELIVPMFSNNQGMFLSYLLRVLETEAVRNSCDFGILPQPKYDEAQESYYSFVSPHGCCFIALPQTVAGNEDYGFLTEALARYSNQYVRPIAYDLVYKEKDSRDERSAEVLNILLDSLYIDFVSLYNSASLNDSLVTVLFNDKPFVSTMEKKQSAMDKALVKLADNWMPVD